MTTKYRKLSDTQAFITAKTYDPVSGAIVKFKTDKTVDLGRLMVGSGKLSGMLAGAKQDEPPAAVDTEMKTEKVNTQEETTVGADNAATTTTTGSSKKKKKKGKK